MSTPNSRTANWTRSGEPGSAFSGLSRGRRGGNRGGGPGRGRGGGGPSRGANRGTKPSVEVATDAPKPPPAAVATADKPPQTPQRPKAPSRKPSAKNIPTTTTTTTTPAAPITNTASDASTTSSKNTSARPPNRRKRSTTNTNSKAPPPITVPKINIDESTSPMTPQNRRNSKASLGLNPPHSAPPMRDTPPHLSTSSTAVNIDALVERVRAVAMDRPSTPGSASHLDWAGDDDDSLPDLDDWGVHTEKSGGEEKGEAEETVEEDQNEKKETEEQMQDLKAKEALISPIMIDGLRSLPDAIPGSPGARASPALSNTHLSAERSPKKRSTSPAPKSPRLQAHRDTTKSTLVPHPSLPPKPSFALANGRGGGRNSRPEKDKFKEKPGKEKSEKPAKSDLPSPTRGAEEPSAPTVNGTDKQSSPSPEVKVAPAEEVDLTPQNGKGLQASIHADPEAELDEQDSRRKGLGSSIHAAPPSEAPSDSPEHHSTKSLNSSIHAPVPSFPSHSPRANGMTHTRAHTLGRPATIPNTGVFNNSRFTRSGTSTPRGRGFGEGRGGHARNHSSPPVAHGYRAPHATRPVLTGDAISRLARTIGGGVSVATSKD
ncbi:hypothetical protein VNI00_001055 [Paramarasmius palmivorus]|uniref:Uncharacterized protein n=1 Tax=Paramarasmius palmivorus TaxID=297713 RepID=A0AAW0E5W9_9AGAR